jgi:hypothetical protein
VSCRWSGFLTATMSTEARATVSPLMRARALARTHFSEHPSVYLPFARRKYPGPSPEVIGPESELVIDGFTRSATTYAVYALQLAQQRPVRLAHHLHAPAQLMAAARTGVPALALIREPEGAILSLVVREPWVDMRDATSAYTRFYRSLMPYRHSFVIGEFSDVTGSFPAVVERLNARYGLSLAVPELSAEFERLRVDLMRLRPTLWPTLLGFESGTVTLAELQRQRDQGDGPTTAVDDEDLWVPSAARDGRKAALRNRWAGAEMRRLRMRAEAAYRDFVGGSQQTHRDPSSAAAR